MSSPRSTTKDSLQKKSHTKLVHLSPASADEKDSLSPPTSGRLNDIPSPPTCVRLNDISSPPTGERLNDISSPPAVVRLNEITSPPNSARLNDIPSPPNSVRLNDIPLPPNSATLNDIPSPPTSANLKGISSSQSSAMVKVTPSIRRKQQMPSFAMASFLSQITPPQNPRCYELPWTPLLSSKCYELPTKKEEEKSNSIKDEEQPSLKRKRTVSEDLEITPKRERLSGLPVRCATDQTPYASPPFYQVRQRLPAYSLLQDAGSFIDTHCHLDFLMDRERWNGTWAQWRARDGTFPPGYEGCLAVFCNPHTFAQTLHWERFLEEEDVWASFGCHPHNARDYNDRIEESLCLALQHPKVRALGEIGLDYSNRNNCDHELQWDAFRRQLKIALKERLPVVLHCREAHQDGMRIVQEVLPPTHPIHLHCFTDTWAWAETWLKAFPNLLIGITNVVTFPSARNAHQVATRIPLDRLLLETDAPYFVPRMVQGVRHSHPGMALHVASQIAALRGVNVQTVLKQTRENTRRLYNI